MAFALSAFVGMAGIALVLTLGPQGHVVAPVHMPWYALAPLYLLLTHFSVDFEFRREARSLQLTHLPFALGAAFVSPIGHLGARLIASSLDSVALRRQSPVKIAYNVAVAAFENGLLAVAMLLAGRLTEPNPVLWAVLLGAVAASEALSQLLLSAVLRLLDVPLAKGHLSGPITAALITAPVATGLSIVAVAAIWTEPLTSLVMCLILGGLTFGYRAHRRLSAQQQTTSELYEFVKQLGPVNVEDPHAADVMEQVRVLLHARHLQLSLVSHTTPGEWTHLTSHEAEADASALPQFDTGMPHVATQTSERMSVPLMGAAGFLGVLTVVERLGSVRDFDLGDLRLIETVGTELGTALERGRLLRDLERAATTDPLTNLPNLNDVSRRIDELLSSSGSILVAAMAVDSFREVNDTLGHQVGDDLLLEVTRRIGISHPDATVGRIGGGRFAVAVPADLYGGDASMFGLGLRAQIEGGAQLGPVGTHVRLSVGCVSAPEHGTDASTLIRRAETAMYSARHAHGGPVNWEPAYEVQGTRRLAVVMALREALSSGAIGVAFQPKLNPMTGDITGVEALARWTHPALGAIGPDEFIPLAEASGLMGPLTSSVLRQALTACKGWQRRGGRIGVAVNVSADTVLDSGFVTEVAALLTSTNVSADLLTLELTEGVLVDDPELAAERMSELRSLGVKLSVDDFGTGYSSLTYLKGLPMDEVKIDKGFVDDIMDEDGDRAVVRAVVDIAHTLGLRVVAEGVEQDEQMRMLQKLGVDEIQGYLLARPMPALEMAQWLRRREGAAVH
jgi:diguanylate cyclase (GGDEF)-like protein